MSTCIFPAWTNEKNAVKMSFYVLIKSYILTRLTRVIKGRPAEYQYEALKPEKNLFLRSWKFLYYKVRKVFLFHLSWKREKKHFLVKSALSFQPVTAKRLVKGFLKWNQWKGNRILPIKIFSDKNIFEGRLSNWGRKTKSVHFCTLRNRVNFTRAGTNGLRKLFVINTSECLKIKLLRPWKNILVI